MCVGVGGGWWGGGGVVRGNQNVTNRPNAAQRKVFQMQTAKNRKGKSARSGKEPCQ